jgi:hypothetical protein
MFLFHALPGSQPVSSVVVFLLRQAVSNHRRLRNMFARDLCRSSAVFAGDKPRVPLITASGRFARFLIAFIVINLLKRLLISAIRLIKPVTTGLSRQ